MATSRKQPAERIIEALTWASVVIWLGFALIAHILNYVWLVVLVLSVILLSSAIYQRSRQWETSLAIWVFGIWMDVFSVLETVNEILKLMNEGSGLDIDIWVYLGVALVSMGVASVFNMISPSDVVGKDKSRRPNDYGYDRERDYAPRRVDEDLSSAWMPPVSDSAEYDSRGRSTASPPDYNRGYDRGSDSRARETTRRADDPFERVPDYAVDRGDYGAYRDSPRDPRRPADDGYYDDPPPRDPRRARRVDDMTGAEWDEPPYGRPTQERPYEGERLSRQRGRGRSQPQRSLQRPQQQSPQQAERPVRSRRQQPGPDLESRVEDIIKRSRSQRSDTVPDGDLPY